MSRSVEELAHAVAGADVVTDASVLEGVRRDRSFGALPAGAPAALVRARSTEQVAAVLRWADRTGTAVVPRGAGSGLSGGANAVDGCIVLSLERMDRILAIEPRDRYAIVEAGVLNATLSRAVRDHRLYYPPDPASWEFSTIGGNVATNAGGLCCLKYGVTGDFVMGLTAVLADGRVLRTGRRTTKGVAGYDLTHLIVGSEGTLAVVTEVTVRLLPAPPQPATLVAFFADLPAAGRAVTAITTEGLSPSLLEIMDRTTIRVVDERARMGLDRDAAALLIAQSDLGGAAAADQIERIRRRWQDIGATYQAATTSPDEGEQLLSARRLAYPALEELGATILDDVAVPQTRIPELLRRIGEVADRHGVLIGTFGHAGDGNMHPTLVYDRDDPASTSRAVAAFDDLLTVTLELGGTVTGEHGVGLLKRDRLGDELGPVSLEVHRAIKRALDPNGVLNPGKVTTATGED